MKLSSLLCAGFVALAALAPTTASAWDSCGPRTRVTYDHCGRPIYWSYVQVGCDCYGRPVFQWVQTSRSGSSGYHGNNGYRPDYGHGHDRGGFDPRRDRFDSGRSRNGISFHWGR